MDHVQFKRAKQSRNPGIPRATKSSKHRRPHLWLDPLRLPPDLLARRARAPVHVRAPPEALRGAAPLHAPISSARPQLSPQPRSGYSGLGLEHTSLRRAYAIRRGAMGSILRGLVAQAGLCAGGGRPGRPRVGVGVGIDIGCRSLQADAGWFGQGVSVCACACWQWDLQLYRVALSTASASKPTSCPHILLPLPLFSNRPCATCGARSPLNRGLKITSMGFRRPTRLSFAASSCSAPISSR